MRRKGYKVTRADVEVVRLPILSYLHRVLPYAKENLFTFIVKANGRAVVATWTDKMGGYCYDIKSWAPWESPTRHDVKFIKYWLSNQKRNDNLRFLNNAKLERRRLHNATEDRQRASSDMRKHIKRKAGMKGEHPIYNVMPISGKK